MALQIELSRGFLSGYLDVLRVFLVKVDRDHHGSLCGFLDDWVLPHGGAVLVIVEHLSCLGDFSIFFHFLLNLHKGYLLVLEKVLDCLCFAGFGLICHISVELSVAVLECAMNCISFLMLSLEDHGLLLGQGRGHLNLLHLHDA